MHPNLVPSLGLAFPAQMGDNAEWRAWDGGAEGWGRRAKESQHFDTSHTCHRTFLMMAHYYGNKGFWRENGL